MKDYNITVKVRNNYLLSAMRADGIETAAELSRKSGVGQSSIGVYLNLKEAPIKRKTGEWRDNIIKISETLRTLPEDLFPPQHIEKALPFNRAEIEMDPSELSQLSGADNRTPELLFSYKEASDIVSEQLDKLPPRKKRVIIEHMIEGRTFEAIGADLGISRSRTAQVLASGMRILKRFGVSEKSDLRIALKSFNDPGYGE